MEYYKHSLLILTLVAILAVGINQADASPGRGNLTIECTDASHPLLSKTITNVSEWDYNVTLTVDQVLGECLMSNKGNYYTVPYIPMIVEIELVDTDFDYTIDSSRITGLTDEYPFELEYSLFNDISYCLTVTSVWYSAHLNASDTPRKTSVMCWNNSSNY